MIVSAKGTLKNVPSRERERERGEAAVGSVARQRTGLKRGDKGTALTLGERSGEASPGRFPLGSMEYVRTPPEIFTERERDGEREISPR